MDLAQRVATELGVDAGQASTGLGILFLSIRMAVDDRTFGQVAAAFPGAGSWMQGAPISGGRTGEMLALGTQQTLERYLAKAGFTDEQITRLGVLTGETLRDSLSGSVYRKITTELPLLAAG